MKAFVMKEIGKVGFMDKPMPRPGPGDGIVRTASALICTSDSHTVNGGIGPRENLTLGHEAVGTVHDVGNEVNDFRPGDPRPGWSYHSRLGKPGLPERVPVAVRRAARRIQIREQQGRRLRRVLPRERRRCQSGEDIGHPFRRGRGLLRRHALDRLHGAEKGNIPIGGTVVVLAQGPAGLMATAGARLRGAGFVIAVESVPSRQKLARTYGADEVVDFTSEDVLDRVLELTRGEAADTAIEALGADATFQTAVKVTKPGGTISNIGYFGEGEFVRIPRVEWGVGMADKTIATGLCPGGRLRMERLLQTNRVDPTHMTTHRFRFDEMERAFEVSDKKLEDVIKVLITF